MTQYDRFKRKRLGDILVSEGVASQEAVIAALKEQKQSPQLLSDLLLDAQALSEWDLARVVVEQYQLPFIDLARYSPHKDLIESYPARLLHGAALVPLDRFGQQTCFACQEVPGEGVVNKLRQVGRGPVQLFVALSLEVRRVLHELAPLEADAMAADTAAAAAKGAPIPFGSMETDGGWKDIFDAANQSVLSELPDD